MAAQQARDQVVVVPLSNTSISFIVPTLNEENNIQQTLGFLQGARQRGHTIVVADGGSQDQTLSLARDLADTVDSCSPGSARQMNLGATLSRSDIVCFVHADTIVPQDIDELIIAAVNKDRCWGRFSIRLSGSHWFFRIIEKMMNLRSCLTGIATGDQTIFIKKDIFDRLGGYADIPIMEDIQISKRLKNISRPVCLSNTVTTSSRRWEQKGIYRTMFLMWRLRLAYALGVKPQKLANLYQ